MKKTMRTQDLFLKNRMMFASLAIFGLIISCQGPEAPKRKSGEDAAVLRGRDPTEPTPTPALNPSASPTAGSCEEQWTQHIAHFKVGSKLIYNAYMTSSSIAQTQTNGSTNNILAQRYTLIHTEEVTASTDAEVTRKITISSTNSFVTALLAVMQLPQTITVKKESFISLCQKASNQSASTVTITDANIQVLESRDETFDLNGKQTPSRFTKLKGTVGTTITADIQAWMSKDISGLVLKQITNLSGLPLGGTAVITDELSSSTVN